jgi:hypothetical protein
MLLVLKAHREIQCLCLAESVGMEVKNLTVANVARPLITKRFIGQCFIYTCGGIGCSIPRREIW